MVEAGRKRDGFTRGVERIAEDRVSKFVGGEAGIEFEKSQAIERALVDTNFTTPKALRFDLATGYVDFEFVPHSARLFDAMLQAHSEAELEIVLNQNRQAAELLAAIHHKLKLSGGTSWAPPPTLLRDLNRVGRHWPSNNEVFLHCDFSPVNILLGGTGGLIVIDASPNLYLSRTANLIGPPLFDLATYTVRLHWPFRARTYSPSWRRLANRLRAEFLKQYEQSSGVLLDRLALKILERHVVRSFVEWKTGSTLISGPSIAMARLAIPSE